MLLGIAALHHAFVLWCCVSVLRVCSGALLHMRRFNKRLPMHVPMEVFVGTYVCECVCVASSNYSTSCVCVSPAPFLLTPSTHTQNTHTHTHTHSNRWLILTEIIRQQSHQHGSVVIRVWTQCLFSSRNGRSAWRKRREMHYSP